MNGSLSNDVNEVVDDGDDVYDGDEKKRMYVLQSMMPIQEVNGICCMEKQGIHAFQDINC